VTSSEHQLVPALRERVAANLESFERQSYEQGHEHGRDEPELRAAAVTLVLLDDEEGRACFVLTRRSSNLPNHPGQWALPGGRTDAGETHIEAALRECREEVGLALEPDQVLGLLDDYPTRSGFVITPVVVWGGHGCQMEANEDEVAAIYRIPLMELDHPDVPRLREIPESERPVISVPLRGTTSTRRRQRSSTSYARSRSTAAVPGSHTSNSPSGRGSSRHRARSERVPLRRTPCYRAGSPIFINGSGCRLFESMK
jgi:8-oxo-dGTP pyrophosphatase MutT (NUDIX family)